MTPRTLTSEASCSWLPAVSVFRVTVATVVNALLYRATDSPSSRRRMVPLTRASPRDPHGRGRAPDGQGQEQVDDVDRDDREPHRPAHREADPGRPAAGPVAVVTVGQDDHDREDQHLEERP